MIVGFLLGSSSAGLYKIVKFIGSTNSKLTDPLSQAIYPDIARSVWQKNYYNSKRLILNPIKLVAAFSVFFIVVFFFFGELMIEIFFGTDFKHAYPPTIFYLFGTFIATITFSFHPTLLAFGKAHLSLLILSISTLVYLFCMFIFIGKMELIGAALSYMIFYLFWSFMQGLLIIHILKRFQDDCA
jgi:O-antigen/teichoic acid export membrane protein